MGCGGREERFKVHGSSQGLDEKVHKTEISRSCDVRSIGELEVYISFIASEPLISSRYELTCQRPTALSAVLGELCGV